MSNEQQPEQNNIIYVCFTATEIPNCAPLHAHFEHRQNRIAFTIEENAKKWVDTANEEIKKFKEYRVFILKTLRERYKVKYGMKDAEEQRVKVYGEAHRDQISVNDMATTGNVDVDNQRRVEAREELKNMPAEVSKFVMEYKKTATSLYKIGSIEDYEDRAGYEPVQIWL